MFLHTFEKNEFDKLNSFMQGNNSNETDEEKMNRYFNQWDFENSLSENSYSDATSSTIDHKFLNSSK